MLLIISADLESVTWSEVSHKEKNNVYECIYVEFRKLVQMKLLAWQEERCRCREWTGEHRAGRGGWDELRAWRGHICTAPRQRDS